MKTPFKEKENINQDLYNQICKYNLSLDLKC